MDRIWLGLLASRIFISDFASCVYSETSVKPSYLVREVVFSDNDRYVFMFIMVSNLYCRSHSLVKAPASLS